MSDPSSFSKPPIKGRGAGSNTTGRFEKQVLDSNPIEHCLEADPDQESGSKPRTRFFTDHAKTVLNRNESPDVGFSFSVNPYRGCEHGCVYCYARPTHEYLGMSPGLDFETKIFVKEDAPALLRAALQKKSYKPEVIVLSGITDCYQPAEKKYGLTRACIEVLSEFKNPFLIISKNHLVTRDIDLIAPMAAENRARVFVTITTLDENLCARLEPRTSRPSLRLNGIRELSQAGIPVGVMIAPVIPGLTDHEMPKILKVAAEAGATSAGYVPLRLPYGVAPLFMEWLENHYPDRKEKVKSLIESIRSGKLNDARFGSRMRGEGPFAELLARLFERHCKELHLNEREIQLDVSAFERPAAPLDLAAPGDSNQLSLF